MKTFYLILATALITGLAIAVNHLTHFLDHRTLQVIVAASAMLLFVALIRFVSKLHD